MYRTIENLRGMNKTANYDPVEPASQDNMYRAFSLPATTERGRNRERLEASLAGICELELLKRRQECLVLGALSLGDNVPDHPAWGNLQPARCAPETPNGAPDEFVLGHQSTSLQCSLWGAMSSLEQQVGELRMGTELHPTEPPTDLEDSRPSSGFYGQCEGQSPVGQSDSSGFVELSPCSTRAIRMAYASSRPKSTGDMFISTREGPTDQACRPQIPRSLSAPYPSLEGIAEDTGEAEEGEEAQAWPWTPRDVLGGMEELGEEDQPTEEDYRQAQRVETYILGLIQRRVLPPRPCKPRTSLGHDARAISLARQSSLCRREDQHQPPFAQSSGQVLSELLAPTSGSEGSSPWAFRSQDPNSYPGLSVGDEALLHYHRLQDSQHQQGHYPRPRQPSLAKTPRSLSLDYPPCGALSSQYQDPSSSEPDSPQHFHSYPSPPAPPPPLPPPPRSPPSSDEQLVNAQYIPAQPCRAPARASAHTSQPHSHSHRGNSGLKGARGTYSPDRGPPHPQLHPHQQQQQPTPPQPQQHSRPRAALKKCRFIEERGSPRKPGKRACRSQSENSLLGQRVPERKYSTVERDGGGGGGGGGSSSGGGGGSRGSQPRGKKGQQGSGSCRRWRSTQELSQDEAEQPTPAPPAQGEQGSRRSRKSRPAGLAYAYPHPHHHQGHPHHVEYQLERERAPLGRPDHSYPHAGPGESESSLSEADSPASSSLSSDSDESGGLVWPQQLPPQLAPPSPPTPAGAPPQPKAFVKIKASHALKKKILRFRTGSLKVMTTV